MKLLKNPGINGREPRIYHSSLIKITDVFTVQETIKPVIVRQNDGIWCQPLTILLVVQVLPHTIMHKTYNLAHHHNLTHGHQLTICTINPLYMFKHQPSWLMDHNPNLTYSNSPQHQLHKLTNPLTIICNNNKLIHCSHHLNHLTHIYCNHSTHKSHHCISCNTHF